MQTNETRKAGGWLLAGDYVRGRINQLLHGGNEALARSSLARLRRGIGKAPGSMADLWGETMQGLPQPLAGQGDAPSYGEWATYLALTLFALHQQSKDLQQKSMHLDGQKLGLAVRALVHSADDEARIKRRFDQVVTAETPQEAAHHLRGIIQLLRADEVPLDYGALAADLYLLQLPQARDGVRLQWGRDFYTQTFIQQTGEEENGTRQQEGEDEQNEEQ